jgi:hypothetical protein
MKAPLSFQDSQLLYQLPGSAQWSLTAELASGVAISALQYVAFLNPMKSDSLIVAAIKVQRWIVLHR